MPRTLSLAAAVLVTASMAGCFRMPPPNSGGGSPPPNYGGGGGGYGDPSGSPAPGSSYAPPPAAAAAPAAGPVSVTIRSSCRETVKVFYGDKPKYGSGTYSTISSNSVSSHTFQQGDMMWIVDDGQNGLSATTVGTGIREIEILPSCSGFRVN